MVTSIVNRDVRVKHAVIADVNARSDGAARANSSPLANAGVSADHGMWPDGRRVGDLCVRRDYGCGVAPGVIGGCWIKPADHSRECAAWILHANQRAAAERKIGPNQQAARMRLACLRRCFAISNER